MKHSPLSSHNNVTSASATVPPEVRADLAASLVIALLEQSRSQQLEIDWLQLEIHWLREQLEFACVMLRPVGTVLQ